MSDGDANPNYSPDLDERDRALIGSVEPSLSRARQVRAWRRQAEAGQAPIERFDLIQSFNRPNYGCGFFGEATVDERAMPVMGVYQDLFFDRRKTGAEFEKLGEELQAFALRYFMRVSDYRQPQAAFDPEKTGEAPCLEALSWCPDPAPKRAGFGYLQTYFKRREDGLIGKFPPDRQAAMIDLRELGAVYDWIVVKVKIFNFRLNFRPFGKQPGLPEVQIPLDEETWLVMTADMIVDQARPEPGSLGRFGLGYALLKDPWARGLIAYGPGRFDAGFQDIHFELGEDGETRARLTFLVNRPRQILDLPLDPVTWAARLAEMGAKRVGEPAGGMEGLLRLWPMSVVGFDPVTMYIRLANLFTGGLAADRLCVSLRELEKEFMAFHYMQHYQMISGALTTWRLIPDWLDEAALPDWVKTGVAS